MLSINSWYILRSLQAAENAVKKGTLPGNVPRVAVEVVVARGATNVERRGTLRGNVPRVVVVVVVMNIYHCCHINNCNADRDYSGLFEHWENLSYLVNLMREFYRIHRKYSLKVSNFNRFLWKGWENLSISHPRMIPECMHLKCICLCFNINKSYFKFNKHRQM